VEAELDCANPQQAVAALQAADLVIAMSAYKHQATEYADVLLPVAPFTETSGTFISTEGRVQSFKGAVKPLGEARPAWKVLRVLGNLLKVEGFDQDTSEAVRDEALKGVDVAARLNNAIGGVEANAVSAAKGLQRVSDVPIYATDAVVRRSAPLQATTDAALPQAWMHSDELKKLGVQSGARVKVSQGQGSVQLLAAADDKLPRGVVRVAAGHAATSALGAMFGTITVERA
jgi:NADH-quinone oxidoreductase subunit G